MLLEYCPSDFETVPVAPHTGWSKSICAPDDCIVILRYTETFWSPCITGIIVFVTSHMRWVSIVRSLYFKISFGFFLNHISLSPHIATPINKRVPFSLLRISRFIVRNSSVCTCWFHNMVTLTSLLVSTDFSTCLYQVHRLVVVLVHC